MSYFRSPMMIYFFKHALVYFLIVLLVLSLITTLSELIEYTKQTSNNPSGGFLLGDFCHRLKTVRIVTIL